MALAVAEVGSADQGNTSANYGKSLSELEFEWHDLIAPTEVTGRFLPPLALTNERFLRR
jgi:hypothetical protein